jgi:hypothetical protein
MISEYAFRRLDAVCRAAERAETRDREVNVAGRIAKYVVELEGEADVLAERYAVDDVLNMVREGYTCDDVIKLRGKRPKPIESSVPVVLGTAAVVSWLFDFRRFNVICEDCAYNREKERDITNEFYELIQQIIKSDIYQTGELGRGSISRRHDHDRRARPTATGVAGLRPPAPIS